MWNIRKAETPSNSGVLDPASPARVEPIIRTAAPALSQSTIGRGWVIKGEITGTEPLFIDGCVEGTINMPGELVTLGPNGRVSATISASDVVVRGTVNGEVVASNRLEIRSGADVTGTLAASRLSIEEGAHIHGGVTTALEESEAASPKGTGKTHLVGKSKGSRVQPEALPMSA